MVAGSKILPKPLLCVDFDGVIHRCSKGFHDGSVYDCPTAGALEFIYNAMKHFKVVIYSARAGSEEGLKEIEDFMKRYDFPRLEITSIKPPAFLTIDDRAITFNGFFPEPETLLDFRAWTGETWVVN